MPQEENKRIARNTLLLYFRTLITTCIGLFTTRVFLQVLGIENVGIYNIVGGIVSMFSLLNGSLTNACSRYIAYDIGRNDNEHLKRIFSTSVTIHITLGIIIIIVAEIVGVWFLNTHINIAPDRLYAANWAFQCSLITFFLNLINTPYQSLIISYEKMGAFAYMSIFDVTCKLLILYLLQLITQYDKLIMYAILMCSVSLISFLIYRCYCIKQFKVAKKVPLKIHRDLFKEMFSYAGWNFFGTGSMMLRNQGIDIVLNIFFGVAINAAKSVSNQIQGAIYSFVSNFQMAINPQITKSYAIRDLERTTFLINQGSRFSFFLLLFLSMPIIILINPILEVWLSEIPPYTAIFVQLTFIYLLLDTLSRLIIIAIMATGNIKKYQIVVGGTKLLAVPITFIYIKYFHGSPITGLIVNIALEIICLYQRLLFARKIIKLNIRNYVKDVVIKSWLIAVLAYIIPVLFSRIPIPNIWITLIVNTIVCTIFSACVIYVLGLTKKEKQLLTSYIHKKIGYASH